MASAGRSTELRELLHKFTPGQTLRGTVSCRGWWKTAIVRRKASTESLRHDFLQLRCQVFRGNLWIQRTDSLAQAPENSCTEMNEEHFSTVHL